MERDKFDAVIRNGGASLSEALHMLREKAEHVIAEQVEAMKERGEAVELGEDELRLLKAYRAFKCRSRPGSRFSWTTPDEAGIVIPESPCLIIDPRAAGTEVSG